MAIDPILPSPIQIDLEISLETCKELESTTIASPIPSGNGESARVAEF